MCRCSPSLRYGTRTGRHGESRGATRANPPAGRHATMSPRAGHADQMPVGESGHRLRLPGDSSINTGMEWAGRVEARAPTIGPGWRWARRVRVRGRSGRSAHVAGPSRWLGPSPRSLGKNLRVRGIAIVERAFWEAEGDAVLLARRARRQPVGMVSSSAAMFGSAGDDPWRQGFCKGPW